MRMSDWSSDVCSSDLLAGALIDDLPVQRARVADAIREVDLATLRHVAHTLRGVSLQLGATALAEQWAMVERTAGAGEAGPVLRLSGELIERHATLVRSEERSVGSGSVRVDLGGR